jgi:hypothetical protein
MFKGNHRQFAAGNFLHFFYPGYRESYQLFSFLFNCAAAGFFPCLLAAGLPWSRPFILCPPGEEKHYIRGVLISKGS